MKTPEEIKRGLDMCHCDYEECDTCSLADLCNEKAQGLAYIQQLERDNAQKDERIRQLEREREAMLRQLSMHCEACKYWEAPMSCKECRTCTNPWKANPKENWEWRGVEEEANEAERSN